MRVERLMAIMRNDDGVIGYIKAERVGTSVRLYLDAHDTMLEDAVAVLNIGGTFCSVSCERLIESYTVNVEDKTISMLSAVFFETPSGRVIALGSNSENISTSQYMPIFEDYISKNSGTYIGVKSHLHDMLEDATDDNGAQEIGTIPPVEDEHVDTTSSDDIDEPDTDMTHDEDIVMGKPDNAVYTENTPFYDAISAQFEDLFSRYEREETLEKAIEGSRFARIYYEDDRYYVVGEVVDENGVPEIICYGYPGEREDTPPSEVKGSYEWLPLERNSTSSHGYYMMYQNAVTGDIIEN